MLKVNKNEKENPKNTSFFAEGGRQPGGAVCQLALKAWMLVCVQFSGVFFFFFEHSVFHWDLLHHLSYD